MTEWLIKKFVIKGREEQDVSRYVYGTFAAVTGIVCNVFLFFLKLTAGVLMRSISIVSDAFNNLSDSFSCIITLIGYRMSSKPADREHPFGHGRMEYIVSFISTIIMFIVTFELLMQSIQKVIHPQEIHFHPVLLFLLLSSVLVKVWLASFNKTVGKRIDSIALLTSAQDARNDVFITLISIGAMILSVVNPAIPFDGIAGVLLSFYLFYAAYMLAKDIITQLLGSQVDSQLYERIRQRILSYPEIMDVHDVMIHEYGPGNMYGSAHAEVDSHMTLLDAHEVIDRCEYEIQEEEHIVMTIHLDPVVKNDPLRERCRKEIAGLLKELDSSLTIHDFRIIEGKHHMNYVFDVVMPFDCQYSQQQITEVLQNYYREKKLNVHLHITYDHMYTTEK